MNILVTGGAGYIGSVLVQQLIDDSHTVVVIDNLSTGHSDMVDDRARFIEGDVGNRLLLEEIFAKHEVEAVIHMAASSIVGESVKFPEKYRENNVTKGRILLDAMQTADVRKIVFSSTAAVYGEPEKQPVTETDRLQPTNPYGKTKLAFERLLHDREAEHGLRSVSLRYFNAAGATAFRGELHDPETHLIPLVLEAALGRIHEVEIFGDDYPTRDGTCVRDYIHVVDLARAHILALDVLDSHSEIYNLGCGGSGYTVREVLETAREITGLEIPEKIGPRREGDPAILIASSAKIKSELGWEPEFQDLSVIIESAWSWMRNRAKTKSGATV